MAERLNLQHDGSTGRPRLPVRVLALVLVLAASLALGIASLLCGWIDLGAVRRFALEHSGRPGVAVMASYVAVVFALELLWLPRMWGLVAGGLLFGPWLGMGLAAVGDLASAAFCYLLGRTAARPWVEALLARRERARRIVGLLARRRGAVTVFVLRALPVHYTAVSYASGVAGVSWPGFMGGTAAGLLPGALLYSFLGDAARQPTSPAFVAIGTAAVVFVLGSAELGRRLWRRPRRRP
ncbi:MAG: VTT domain-containing protein [Deltaproteobacteria bacterium]|nr:VTT domain-containing protein [Deltaproteobacteria bacterium]